MVHPLSSPQSRLSGKEPHFVVSVEDGERTVIPGSVKEAFIICESGISQGFLQSHGIVYPVLLFCETCERSVEDMNTTTEVDSTPNVAREGRLRTV